MFFFYLKDTPPSYNRPSQATKSLVLVPTSPGNPEKSKVNCEEIDGHPHKHGSLNVPIEHHPTIRYMVYNGYHKVMSNIPKMGQLPTPDKHGLFNVTY
jgi:hypothetical protein